MSGIFLQSSRDVTVKVHPLVLFSVLEHYVRRNEGQKRVIGTLMGYKEGSTLHVTDCYAVPHDENPETGEIAIGKDYSLQMYELMQASAVDKRSKIVGWYASAADGMAVSNLTCLIHDFYGELVEISQPVHMVVDTSLANNQVSTKVFVSKPIIIKGRVAPLAQFQQVKVEIECADAERSAMDLMIKGSRSLAARAQKELAGQTEGGEQKDGGAAAGTLSAEAAAKLLEGIELGDQPIDDDIDGLERSIKRLVGMLSDVETYVQGVTTGKIKADDELGRRIANVLGTVSRIDAGSFDKLFNNSLQDLLMVMYLTSLARAQLHIAEKLQSS